MSKFTLDNAGNYGEVRSVNGIKPDEHGNVQADNPDLIIEFNKTLQLNVPISSGDFIFTKGSIHDVLAAYSECRRPVVKIVQHYYENEPGDTFDGVFTFSHSYETYAHVGRYGTNVYLSFIYHDHMAENDVFKHIMRFENDGELYSSNLYYATMTEVQ